MLKISATGAGVKKKDEEKKKMITFLNGLNRETHVYFCMERKKINESFSLVVAYSVFTFSA